MLNDPGRITPLFENVRRNRIASRVEKVISLDAMTTGFHRAFIGWQSRRAAKTIAEMNPRKTLEVWTGSCLLYAELCRLGVDVTASDYMPTTLGVIHADAHCLPWNAGEFDLVVCSNVLEHLHSPPLALREFRRVGCRLWLSWTPWWSPFGAHSYFPWHWLGIRRVGPHYTLCGNLFKTTVAGTLRNLQDTGWTVTTIRPRYWPWLSFLARWRLTREWLTWNVEIHAR